MKIDWSTLVTVLLALLIFKAIDKMFLDSLIEKFVPNFEDLED